jgi:hypothetical protein
MSLAVLNNTRGQLYLSSPRCDLTGWIPARQAVVVALSRLYRSGFIQHAVAVALDDVAGWGALLAEALRETGGALSDAERSWADEILGVNLPSRPAA